MMQHFCTNSGRDSDSMYQVSCHQTAAEVWSFCKCHELQYKDNGGIYRYTVVLVILSLPNTCELRHEDSHLWHSKAQIICQIVEDVSDGIQQVYQESIMMTKTFKKLM